MKILAAIALLLSVSSHASTLNAIDFGWYNENGFHSSENDNYIVGTNFPVPNIMYRNFFVFDLSGLGDVESATLRLFTFQVPAQGQFVLWDVQTEIASLVAGGQGLTSTYGDLGSGESYGNISISADQDNEFIEITLNSAAIDSINAAGGLWALGGSNNNDDLTAFGASSDFHIPQLILQPISIPIPSAFVFLISGLCILRRQSSMSSKN